jgi:single-strand DNA-binding protein
LPVAGIAPTRFEVNPTVRRNTVNSIQLTARLAQHPVYRELPGTDGKHVTELRLAVKGMGSGDRDAVGYVDVVSYTMTEKAAQTIDTGWLVAVAGRLEHQTWEKDGVKRGKHRIVASRVEFLAAPRNGDGEPDVSDFEPDDVGDDVPF